MCQEKRLKNQIIWGSSPLISGTGDGSPVPMFWKPMSFLVYKCLNVFTIHVS